MENKDHPPSGADIWSTDPWKNPSLDSLKLQVTWTPLYQHITLLYVFALEELTSATGKERHSWNRCKWNEENGGKSNGEKLICENPSVTGRQWTCSGGMSHEMHMAEREEMLIHSKSVVILNQHGSKDCQGIVTIMSLNDFWKIRGRNKSKALAMGSNDSEYWAYWQCQQWCKRKDSKEHVPPIFKWFPKNCFTKVNVSITGNKFKKLKKNWPEMLM